MLICVTHRLLCPDDFLARLERIASQHPYAIVLREKDLSEDEYEALARDCLAVCRRYDVPLNINTHIEVARRIGCGGVHLPFHLLQLLWLVNLSPYNVELAAATFTLRFTWSARRAALRAPRLWKYFG